MPKILHLSDLHFGTETKAMLDLLLMDLEQIEPDLIVISGDFTQRALHSQFRSAQQFLKVLDKKKVLCVPGNHDISLHNPFERFFYPFEKYKRYISKTLNPQLEIQGLAILGVNSVTPFKSIQGKITTAQLNVIHNYFRSFPATTVKIAVMHHNLIRSDRHKIISNSEELIATLGASKVNLVLSGHLHYACYEQIERDSFAHPLYVVTAGTAVSRRLRQGQNSYNILQIDSSYCKMSVRVYDKNQFITFKENEFNL
ncbi:MAG: metallophosphoesterase [Gammaproteobacteria bacterium]|nr:metallophosphoesterase [Gammaproteobacteria bacterium]